MAMLTQTREMKTIHPKHCKEMTIPKQKLRAQRRRRNNAIKENTQHPGTKGRIRETEYIKNAEKAEITQLVAIHPEMTNGMGLHRESRKQLEELMIEYPAKTRELGKEKKQMKRNNGEITHA